MSLRATIDRLLLRADRARGRDPLGPRGERVAERHLRRMRFRLLGRNLRVPMGEADLLFIGPDRRTVVLVEVKSRRAAPGQAAAPFAPELSVTDDKRRTLVAILRYLAHANHWHDRPLRIDVVAVEFAQSADPLVRHHPGIIRVDL